jgi:hypothetical protein
MGLLDDAIREHLELKRRHGADPGEVEQQEREALGAARRGEFAPASDEEAAPPPPPFDAEEAVPEAAEPPEFDHRPPREEAAIARGYDEDPWLDEERDEVPAEEALDRPTEEVPPAEDEKAEDVLEETPDFLQETPEHDRLWFEQRPPRDFDWDK